MLGFGKANVAKEELYVAKRSRNICDANVNHIVISKLVEMKTNSKYLIRHLEEVVKPLDLILLKISECVKTFKEKGEHRNKNDKLMSLHKDDKKLLEKYKTIKAKIEDLKSIELDT